MKGRINLVLQKYISESYMEASRWYNIVEGLLQQASVFIDGHDS